MGARLLSTGTRIRADDARPDVQYVETKVVDGFSIGVRDFMNETNSPVDRELCFSIWTTTNDQPRVLFPSHQEYAYQIELSDSNGVTVPKTAMGRKVGARFSDFNVKKQTYRTIVEQKTVPSGWRVMFRPSDLFEIQKPGDYTLRIRFQMLRYERIGPQPWDFTNVPVIFPPLDYPLFKP